MTIADSKQLQDDLHALAGWEQRWVMEFHLDKCKVLLISRSNCPIEFEYTLHGHKLEHVTNAKYLGSLLIINSHGMNTSALLQAKLMKTLGFLRRQGISIEKMPSEVCRNFNYQSSMARLVAAYLCDSLCKKEISEISYNGYKASAYRFWVGT